ncbi:hypothetical protein [Pseudonocardia adelaidensis]|uniref:Uncharacterized protein n=1 Tax=Pseudonocardia adelaidensis TaxID=648754 RepID=A0ABP9NT44_9PSEU
MNARTGPAYTGAAWFARHLDPHGVLGHNERDDTAADLHRRHAAVIDAIGRHDVDPYTLADALITRARRRLDAEHREPLPTAEPIDLDTLLADVHLMDERPLPGPMEPSPFRWVA